LPSLCPTDAELAAAIRSRDDAVVQNANRQGDAERYGLVSISTQRILRISDVLCGDEATDQPPTITCKFTVRYWNYNAYTVAELSRRNGKWEIAKDLLVNRDRR